MNLTVYPIDFLWDRDAKIWRSVCEKDVKMCLQDTDLGRLISRLEETFPNLYWLSATDDGKIKLHGMTAKPEETT